MSGVMPFVICEVFLLVMRRLDQSPTSSHPDAIFQLVFLGHSMTTIGVGWFVVISDLSGHGRTIIT
jgi:hypothetical protein